jgi:murein tripeptide amidase MpaA
MKQQLIDSSRALREAIDRLGCEYRVIGAQRHGREILLVRAGGTSQSLQPALVTGGAHTDEHASILACVELIERIKTDRPVYIIPCRDPLGIGSIYKKFYRITARFFIIRTT